MATSFELQIFPMEEQPSNQNLLFPHYQSSIPMPPCCDSFNIKLQYLYSQNPSNPVFVEDQFLFPRDLFCDMGVNLLDDTFSYMHIPSELLHQVAPQVVSFARNMVSNDNYKGRHTLNIAVKIHVTNYASSAPSDSDDSCRSRESFVKEVRVDDDDASCCSICLDKFCDRTSEVVGTPCSHVFYRDCILRWLKDHSSCPMCRYQVP
ncbi:hypothetical protein L6164_029084 [Bauhinia variegata]|uniref:Uncharacterized protein n=1 Tax=Bauhinia variegata TaxID=167791 RepID=A0ACB9L8W3_BAUVA|nr:hypothetical protein L6164_029084 [Bauhinia variegata]